ncbi:MAG: hypothetical protein RR662_03830 [Clostridia bacterium]
MACKFELDLNDFIVASKKMGVNVDKVLKEKLPDAIKIMHREAELNAPRAKKNRSKYTSAHLADAIPCQDKASVNGTYYQIKFGWEKVDNSEHYYSKFLEWGTSKMLARPFIEPAVRKKSKEALNLLYKAVEKEVERFGK